MPRLRLLFLALALTHAVGLAELVRRSACEVECRDDGCGDDCGPGETSCACHCPAAAQLLGPAVTPAVTAAAAPQVRLIHRGEQRVPANPDPREILHVPRPAGA